MLSHSPHNNTNLLVCAFVCRHEKSCLHLWLTVWPRSDGAIPVCWPVPLLGNPGSFAFLKQTVWFTFCWCTGADLLMQCSLSHSVIGFYFSMHMLPVRESDAWDLSSCMLCFLSPSQLGIVPQQTPFSYWLNHKLRISHTKIRRYCQGSTLKEILFSSNMTGNENSQTPKNILTWNL